MNTNNFLYKDTSICRVILFEKHNFFFLLKVIIIIYIFNYQLYNYFYETFLHFFNYLIFK